MTHGATEALSIKPIDARFVMRLFVVFLALAILSLGVFVAGKFYGHAIALGGHTEDTTVREIVIGNNVLHIPASMIRFENQRRGGVQARVDLYLHWPEMTGYSREKENDFNNLNGTRNIVFLSFEDRVMSRDMSGRVDPIYSEVTVKPGIPGPAGLTFFGFGENSGYLDELLATAPRSGDTPYAARCLAGEAAARSLAPCERDIHVGDHLSLTYRFSREFLEDWRRLDAAVMALADSMLQHAQ
ncbi:MAG: hypothetical protein K8H74_13235 [Notoacmeibacter sp.]|nr:hypothetical protein [Notoacmeibacter sp.]